jgi:hypothetical protein
VRQLTNWFVESIAVQNTMKRAMVTARTAARRLLLKTTICDIVDDWNIDRFARLAGHLASLRDGAGTMLYEVTARNRRTNSWGDDVDLEALAPEGFDQLWLFAVDETGALTAADCEAILRFRARGGGCLLTRDHQNLGACLANLGPIGLSQHFQKANPEPDTARQRVDDVQTPHISWPNYHSGANGDFQAVEAAEPLHVLMRRSCGEPIRFLPAHPHEGAVGVPPSLAAHARVIARGRSLTTGIGFNLAVAIDEPGTGRVVSDCSFHHFADYNWDPRLGAPSFVDEPAGEGMIHNIEAQADARKYAENIAAWLARTI